MVGNAHILPLDKVKDNEVYLGIKSALAAYTEAQSQQDFVTAKVDFSAEHRELSEILSKVKIENSDKEMLGAWKRANGAKAEELLAYRKDSYLGYVDEEAA